MATAKRTVAHRNLYLSVGGKLQHVEAGTEVSLSDEQAKRLGNKLVPESGKKAVKADGEKPSVKSE